MIGTLTGIITTAGKSPIIIDVHDVGYLVHVPAALVQSRASTAAQTLYIHTHVREDALDLYGFSSPQDLTLFELLITVSGIGPKTALSVMDHGTSAVEKAVRESDVDFFTTVPRLGRKNAQKIIIELKNKLGSLSELDLTAGGESETRQIIDSLMSMGFRRVDIIESLKKGKGDNLTLEQKVRETLKHLGK